MPSIISATTTNGLSTSADNSGSLQLATNNGTTAVTIDTSQNVGIGTSSPAQRLDVSGTSRYTFNVSNAYTLQTSINAAGSAFADDYKNALSHIWQTSGSERMRIDSSGNVCIGLTNADTYRINIKGGNQPVLRCENTNQNDLIAVKGNSGGSSGSGMYVMAMRFGDDTLRGAIYWNGSVVQYQTTSDYRLKENIAPMTGALAKVSALKPCTYTWKESGQASQGFIAHELQEVCPDAVVGKKDDVETYKDEEGNEQTRIKPQGIDTSFLVATLTAAIQELNAKVEAQAVRIAELEGAK